ncbi:MAG: DUF4185 domain-containing protein, partial [candidate division Zixibacteria bacterium]|nr:DUF4185 domain-containing protein [candidate division Zixibacteria bacterium]
MEMLLKLLNAVMRVLLFLVCMALINANADAGAGDAVQSRTQFTSSSWESGQKMFYSDTYWRGGDCASTVDLGDGRVLWLFADSYIGVKPPYRRDICCVKMIRNCMGIQTGYDPSTADFTVYWPGTKDSPEAFFPAEDTSWFWPGNGIRIDDILIVFLMRVCDSDSGLGFVTCGHAAFLISDIDGDPGDWSISRFKLPDNEFGIMLGAATIFEPPYLYAFSVKEPGNHAIYLARWHVDSLLMGSAEAIEWWTGDSSAWVSQSRLTVEPAVLFTDGATELSVVYDARTDQYLAIQTVGWCAADVMMRTAPALTGPWSALQL